MPQVLDARRVLNELLKFLGIVGIDHVAREEDGLLDAQALVPQVIRLLGQGLVVQVDHVLHLGHLHHGVQRRRLVSDLDHLGIDLTTRARIALAPVELGEEFAEALGMLWAVLVDLDDARLLVRLHEGIEKQLLEMHGALKLLVRGADLRLQADNVKVEALGRHHSLDELGEATLGAARQQDAQSIGLLDGEPDEVHDGLVPPSLPRARLFYV